MAGDAPAASGSSESPCRSGGASAPVSSMRVGTTSRLLTIPLGAHAAAERAAGKTRDQRDLDARVVQRALGAWEGDAVIADVQHQRLVQQPSVLQDREQATDIGVGPIHAALEVRQVGAGVRRVHEVGRNRDALGLIRLAAETVPAHAVGLAEANLHNEWPCAVRVDELRDAGNDRLDVAGLVEDVIADALWVAGGVFHAPVAAAVADGAQDLRDRALVRV